MPARILAFVVVLAIASDVAASPILLYDDTYKSSADSPFDLAKGGYYLEDFEDGRADTPGLVIRSIGKDHGAKVLDFANGAVSVDLGGSSLLADEAHQYGAPGQPPRDTDQAESYILIEFDPDVLGGLPTDFGVVVTQENLSPAYGDFSVHGYGAGGGFSMPLRGFVGAHLDEEIHTVILGMRKTRIDLPVFQLDHIQYGAIVPEPSTALLMALGCLIIAARRFR